MEHRKIYEFKQRSFQIKHNGDFSKKNSLLANIQYNRRPIDLKHSKMISNRSIPISRNKETLGVSNTNRNNCHIFISESKKTRNDSQKNFNEIQNKSSRCLRRNNTNKNIYNNCRDQPKTLSIDTKSYKYKNNVNNQREKIISRMERKKIQNAQYNINEIKVNNLTYYIKCPYCHHTLNDIHRNEFTNRQISYQRKENDLENRNPNIKNIIGRIYDSYNGQKKIIKNNEFGRRSFYVNEKGVTVFKPPETHSIIIEKTYKPDLSRYHKDSITYGKKNNNSYYEAPVPKKTVIIRPIFN